MGFKYVWEGPYEVAFLENDNGKMPSRIQAAQAVIVNRIQELQLDHGGSPEERQAITEALRGLNVLRGELENRSSRYTVEQGMNAA